MACENTCGQCHQFFETIDQCGHPMVYLNHTTNVHHTKADTESCGFFDQKSAGHVVAKDANFD